MNKIIYAVDGWLTTSQVASYLAIQVLIYSYSYNIAIVIAIGN